MKFSTFALALFFICISSQNLWAKSITVMSYNVENLFDTEHDAGKEDWTFLPLSHPEKVQGCEEVKVEYYKKTCLETDWTADKLQIKLGQINKVLKSGGNLPDILVLLEIENANVIKMLQKVVGYKKHVLTNGPDDRGVDVAVLYNPSADLSFVSSKAYKLNTSRFGITSATRDILEVNFKSNEKPFSIYVNHWPSQQSGPNSRASAAKQLLDIIKSKLVKSDSKIMLIGDFNVTDVEKPNPINDILVNNTGLVDLFSKLTQTEREKLPKGTYFYGWDFTWHRLDRVIVNDKFLTGTPSIKPNSYTIYAPSFMNRVFEQKNSERPHFGEKDIVPWGYWHNAYMEDKAGFSDHYPILVNIDI